MPCDKYVCLLLAQMFLAQQSHALRNVQGRYAVSPGVLKVAEYALDERKPYMMEDDLLQRSIFALLQSTRADLASEMVVHRIANDIRNGN